jgi:hypothetical protein
MDTKVILPLGETWEEHVERIAAWANMEAGKRVWPVPQWALDEWREQECEANALLQKVTGPSPN